jgi:hypothetical protein
VNVMLKPDDIVHACPGISVAEAEHLLDHHASSIAAKMLSAGLSAAVEIIKQQGADITGGKQRFYIGRGKK